MDARVDPGGGLRQVADLDPGARPARARAGLQLAGQHAHEHGLAGAVGADDADALAARDDEVDVEQHGVLAERDVDALEREHALAAARRR